MTHQPAPHADRDHSEEQLTTSMFDNFIHPCLDCGTTIRVVNGQRQPHECQTFGEQDSQVAYAWWQGYDAAKASQTPAPSSDVRSSHVVGDGPSIVGMVDSFGRPATVFTPPEDLRRDPARWPTPEEFVTEWERYTPDQRLQLAERILADGQAVADCTIHLMKRREVEAERDALRAENERYRALHESVRAKADEALVAERDALRAEVERLNESTGEVWREMNEHINDATDRAEAAEAALAEQRAKVTEAIGAAWDDGNATGLDGWIGPNRGEEPDAEGIRAREHYVAKALASLSEPDATGDDRG